MGKDRHLLPGARHTFRLVDGQLKPHATLLGVFTNVGARQGARFTGMYVTADTTRMRPRKVKQDSQALDTIREILGLSETELADLFRVRRESLAGWRKSGIPAGRRASVARMFDLAQVLHRDIKPERIPEIVRTDDAWLAHGTIIETIKHDGPDAVYAYLHRLFSYAG